MRYIGIGLIAIAFLILAVYIVDAQYNKSIYNTDKYNQLGGEASTSLPSTTSTYSIPAGTTSTTTIPSPPTRGNKWNYRNLDLL